jgi:protein-disulfide isomerase
VSVLPEIEREYIESGKAKFEAKPIAILGEESVLAASAAECANDQGRYWEFHDILFANQGREGSGAFSADNLKRFAEALSLDTAAFNTCLDTGKYESQVQAATQTSRADGVKVTPTILVNGVGVDLTFDAIKAAIETALATGS